MAKLRPWPARWPIGKRPLVGRYVLLAGETFKRGDLVAKDGSDRVYEVTGADPTPLLGVASEDAEHVVEAGYTQVYLFDTNDVWFGMQGNVAPAVGDVGTAYGIVRDSDDVWLVDKSEVVNTRVTVMDVHVPQEIFMVSVIAAHRQSA